MLLWLSGILVLEPGINNKVITLMLESLLRKNATIGGRETFLSLYFE